MKKERPWPSTPRWAAWPPAACWPCSRWAMRAPPATAALAFTAMPGLGADVEARQGSCRSMWFIAAAAGGLTALASGLGASLGGFATGLLSSLPLITGAVAVAEHTGGGHRAAARFLRGY